MESFEDALRKLINKWSEENKSDTPDLILAKYIQRCLNAFNSAVIDREHWYGRKIKQEIAAEELKASEQAEHNQNRQG